VRWACGSGQRSFCAIFFVALLKLQFSSAMCSLFRHFFPRAAHPAQKVHEKRKNGTTTIYLLPLLYFSLFFVALHGEKEEEQQNKSDSRTGF